MNWFKKHIWLILAIFVAIFAGRMLLTNKHFYTHDDIQVYRVNEFIECFGRGEIPCRWSNSLGKGYGYPWFNYYPPVIYAIPSIIHLTGVSIITSLNLFMFLTFLLAAWGMYLLIKELTRRDDLAFFGSVLFTLYPFHATNVFLRGVYAENLSWSITPFILFLIYRQFISAKFAKLLPILFAMVFLTHIISSFLVVGISVLWILFLLINQPNNIVKNIKFIVIQVLVGVGMAAFFLLPALLEKGLVQSDSLVVGYYSFINHFVSLKQLFIEYTWNYGASYWAQPREEMGYMVGHIHTILLIVVTGLGFLFYGVSKGDRRTFNLKLAINTLFATGVALLLTHPKSMFIWSSIPSLAYIQFPWRFVGWAGIPLVITISLMMTLIPKKIGYVIMFISLLGLLTYSYPFFFPREYDNYNDSDFLTGSLKHEQESKALFDYLPVSVKTVPVDFADSSNLPVKVFYFPGWSANVNGLQVDIEPDPIFGLIRPVTHLDGQLTLTWSETPFRKMVDIISIFTILGYCFYTIKSHVQ